MKEWSVLTPYGYEYRFWDLKKEIGKVKELMEQYNLQFVYIHYDGIPEWPIITRFWLEEALTNPNKELPVVAYLGIFPSKNLHFSASKKSLNQLLEEIKTLEKEADEILKKVGLSNE
jgi:hypothetical protein